MTSQADWFFNSVFIFRVFKGAFLSKTCWSLRWNLAVHCLEQIQIIYLDEQIIPFIFEIIESVLFYHILTQDIWVVDCTSSFDFNHSMINSICYFFIMLYYSFQHSFLNIPEFRRIFHLEFSSATFTMLVVMWHFEFIQFHLL